MSTEEMARIKVFTSHLTLLRRRHMTTAKPDSHHLHLKEKKTWTFLLLPKIMTRIAAAAATVNSSVFFLAQPTGGQSQPMGKDQEPPPRQQGPR